MGHQTSAEIIEQLQSIYDEAVTSLSEAMADYASTGRTPGPEFIAERRFCYPKLTIDYHAAVDDPSTRRSMGVSPGRAVIRRPLRARPCSPAISPARSIF